MKWEFFIKKLLEWNKVHNLSGVRTKEEVLKNIQDSLKPLEFLPKKEFKNGLDIGTGAGFPGLILAMEMPTTHWYLVEPRRKRVAFLNYIKTALGLENVTIIPNRLEEIEPFKVDLITSRAVTSTPTLLKMAKPFAHLSTTFLLYKGEKVTNELEGIENFKLFPSGKRNYLIIEGLKGV
ncbi:MAG: 16S rRNA (guanine(527)-N(7))-methyltransferase RsmG [Epsilonproteobacteria bacterium]|nr:16S rRNA (guanine(527)-N(7))-methyltransferase RsmG [Campylobacterota bacterium]